MLYDKSSIILYYLVFNLLYSLALSPANFRPSHFSTFIMAARNVGNHMSTYYTYPKAHHKFLKHSASESLSRTSHIYRLIVILYLYTLIKRYVLNYSQNTSGILHLIINWIGMLALVILVRLWSGTSDQLWPRHTEQWMQWTNLESQTISWQTLTSPNDSNDEWTPINTTDKWIHMCLKSLQPWKISQIIEETLNTDAPL